MKYELVVEDYLPVVSAGEDADGGHVEDACQGLSPVDVLEETGPPAPILRMTLCSSAPVT